MEIAKANESLNAAEHCYTEGLYNSSVSRAYYSADYRDSDVSKRQATRALAKAREFVSLIKKGMSNG